MCDWFTFFLNSERLELGLFFFNALFYSVHVCSFILCVFCRLNSFLFQQLFSDSVEHISIFRLQFLSVCDCRSNVALSSYIKIIGRNSMRCCKLTGHGFLFSCVAQKIWNSSFVFHSLIWNWLAATGPSSKFICSFLIFCDQVWIFSQQLHFTCGCFFFFFPMEQISSRLVGSEGLEGCDTLRDSKNISNSCELTYAAVNKGPLDYFFFPAGPLEALAFVPTLARVV